MVLDESVRSLDDVLLIGREGTRLVAAERAVFHPVSPSAQPVPALVITRSASADFQTGIKSGSRSAIAVVGNSAIKYKGTNIGHALEGSGPYRKPHGNSPWGGLRLSCAEREIEATIRVNEILKKHEFATVHEPLGVVDYGALYEPNFLSYTQKLIGEAPMPYKLTIGALLALAIASDFVYPSLIAPNAAAFILPIGAGGLFLLKKYGRISENLAASVMKIEGDTRLPEIIAAGIKDRSTAACVMYQFGLSVGAQKRTLEQEGFMWNEGDTHPGNLIVHGKGNNYHITPTDFDFSGNYGVKASGKQSKEAIEHLLSSFGARGIVDKSTRVKISDTAVTEAVNSFKEGFWDGYKNPDHAGARTPIKIGRAHV